MSKKTLKELVSTLKAVKSSDPTFDWNLDLLKDCLHTALTIEFATIPPYLVALWSIKVIDFGDPPSFENSVNKEAYQSLRDQISEEEMIHMGLVCNLLVALGETPSLRSSPPTYPGSLPGQLAGEDIVSLKGYPAKGDEDPLKEPLQTFLDIEFPKDGPIEIANDPMEAKISDERAARDNLVVESAETIGQFYDSILEGFETLFTEGDTFPADSQLTQGMDRPDRRGVFKINNLNDVRDAIALIQRQGEGSSSEGSPGDESDYDLAHYYRFLELHRERQITAIPSTDPTEFEFTVNEKYDLPEQYPEHPENDEVYHIIHEPSTNGYENEDQLPQSVQDNLNNFDIIYTDMLRYLEAAWSVTDVDPGDYQNEGQLYLKWAVGKMYELKPIAQALMEEGYGPCFRVVDQGLSDFPDFPDVNEPEPNPTWDTYIKKLMTEEDVIKMRSYLDLRNCEQVRDYAEASPFGIESNGIIDRVSLDENSNSLMPKGGPRWPEAWITSFQNWIDNGFDGCPSTSES